MSASPLYSFGYGLSYSTFEYSNLKVTQQAPLHFEISFDVENTGKYDGEEVAQLYIRDEYASVVRALRQLKHFKRFFLKQGEKKNNCIHFGRRGFIHYQSKNGANRRTGKLPADDWSSVG